MRNFDPKALAVELRNSLRANEIMSERVAEGSIKSTSTKPSRRVIVDADLPVATRLSVPPDTPSNAASVRGQKAAVEGSASSSYRALRKPFEPGEIQIWCTDLCVRPDTLRTYERLLSLDEAARAARFRFDRDRRRFVVARGVLRLLLAQLVGCEPADVRFATNRFGKPWLAMPGAPHFSVSHSHELAAYAIAGEEVGIDIEWERPMVDVLEIARRFFARSEIAALEAVPINGRDAAFLMHWTRKEACLKANGVGLSGDLASLSVRIGEDPNVVIIEDPRSHMPHEFRLQTVDVARGYLGALATSCQVEEYHVCKWRHEPAAGCT